MANIVDAPVSQLDSSTRLFDSFYNFELVIDANRYEIVYSTLYDITKSKSVASNFTTILFRIAETTGDDVLALLDTLRNKSFDEMNYQMALYLNSIKSKTTLYGINDQPVPNEYVQRNIIL
jgi:hypothetical protein